MIPFEKMVLATTSHSIQQRFTLPKNWKDYQSEQVVWFKLICINIQKCEHLANEMRQSANQFSDFQIVFSVASQSSQTKQTVIRVENMQGRMTSKRVKYSTAVLSLAINIPDDADLQSTNTFKEIQTQLEGTFY